MRAFLAVELHESLQDKVLEIQDKLKESKANVKFVEKENLHFTCKFFGEIPQEKKDKITNIIEEKIPKYNSFEINIKGLGVFPHMGYIRVIWLGLEEAGYFSKILKDFDEEFVKLGYKKERSYIPHLTIGRVKSKKNKEVLTSLIKELEGTMIGTMKVDKIALKKSELTPKGPIYTTVSEFKL
ncbi:MAG TPA: RNA 2',3'-cyclic phosphodiesterase [Methanobacterium sp.]|jgi:2'-5' RNA ligase|nr:MAG: RNA 2',3'-cyclic phosphodiesterase [Methanobacterium sp.]HOI71191.1 RNA 2',3'-cyclic phosphodiesterase [Methanobacterium sp.]